MNPSRTRALLLASVALLAAVVLVWVAWPDGEPSADLVAVAPIETTTVPATSTTTTTAPAPAETAPPPPPAPSPEPTRIRVPSIGIDTRIVPVGLRLDGQMEVPPAADVGWYRLGPAPGAPGSAVLAAHVDQRGQRGAFFDLRSVPIGAEVFVDDGGGTKRFVVSAREQVGKDQVQLERYFTASGPTRVTLITCGGVFDSGSRHYADNIIVTADLVP